MKKIYIYQSLCSKPGWIGVLFMAILPLALRAQQGSNGNASVLNSGEVVVFGAHTFAPGDPATTQPGVIHTDRSPISLFSFYEAASHSGSSDASHVDGYVGKYGTAAFTFPVGHSGKLRPASISAGASPSFFRAAYWLGNPNSAVLPAGAPFPTANVGTGINAVSNLEYWDVDGASSTSLTLSWDATSALATLTGGALTRLVIVGYNPATSKWENLGNAGGTTGTLATTGTVTANNVTPDTYTAFTFGANDSALPVTLVDFRAAAEGKSVALNWTTTSETNSKEFEVQRSADGTHWSVLGTVRSTGDVGNTTRYSYMDNTPLSGQSYYRLKMIDLDATYAFSWIRTISLAEIPITLFPNPVSETLSFQGADLSDIVQVTIYSTGGTIMYSKSGISTAGINVSKFVPGIYIVDITKKNGDRQTRKVQVIR